MAASPPRDLTQEIAELREALRLEPAVTDARYRLALALLARERDRDERDRAASPTAAEQSQAPADVRARTYLDLGQALIARDSRRAAIRDPDGSESLVLLTCYPFDAVTPRGPLRYAVVADRAGK